jgi:ribose 5-phosphate isomerase A
MARAADQFLVLVDQSKMVARIGEKFPIPVEVMPFAWSLVKRRLEAIGGQGELRPNAAKDGLAMTSHGSLVLDMTFDKSISSRELDAMLNSTPGVVEHGIFFQLTSVLMLAKDGRVEESRP